LPSLKEKIEDVEKKLEEVQEDLDGLRELTDSLKIQSNQGDEEELVDPLTNGLKKIEEATKEGVKKIENAQADISEIFLDICKVLEDEVGIGRLVAIREKIKYNP
jgi:seryl-tRNA synthetase